MKIKKITPNEAQLKMYKSQPFVHRKTYVSSGYKKIVVATDADLD